MGELNGTKLEITKNGTYTPEKPYNAFVEVKANMEPDLSEYFGNTIKAGTSSVSGIAKIIRNIPLLIIEGNSCNNMFNTYDIGLVELPKLDTSNCISAINMCGYCKSLETIPLLDFGKMTSLNSCFYQCNSLKNLGGFLNLGLSFLPTVSANNGSYKFDLSSCTDLTHDSLMNVGNNLYDIKSKGCNAQQVILGTNKTKLSVEELLVFTNKGFTVS